MNTYTAIGIILIGIGLVLILPFVFIWAINGLFSMSIAYTWWNWFYSFLILAFLRVNTK